MCCRQLRLLLWRQWLLQKRQGRQFFFQLVIPSFIIGVLLLIRFAYDNIQDVGPTYWVPFTVDRVPRSLRHPAQYIPIMTGRRWTVTYSPVNEDTIKVMAKVKTKLDVIIKGFATEKDLVNYTSLETGDTYATLGGVVFITTNISALYKSYELVTRFLDYKLRFPAVQRSSGEFDWHTADTFPHVITSYPRDAHDHYGGNPGYYKEGFLALQRAVDSALIEVITEKTEQMSEVSVKLRRFPYPQHQLDPIMNHIHLILAAFLILAYCIPLPTLISDLIYEKEKMIKEFNSIYGVRNSLSWFAWFLKAILLLLLLAVIMLTVIFVPVKDLRILRHSDVTVVAFLLFCYAFATVMFSYLMSSIFVRAFSGCIVGVLIFAVSWLPYFTIDHRFYSTSMVEKTFASLLHNVAMSCGFKIVAQLELSGEGVQWSHVVTSVSDIKSFGIGCVCVLLLCDSIIYALLAAYLNAVLPGRGSPAKPPYFIFLPKYWGIFEEDILDEEFTDLGEVLTSQYFQNDPPDLPIGVKIRKLGKEYSTDGSKGTAVAPATLDLFDEEISVIYGLSGSGKSTIVNMLIGLLAPTSGTALVNGWDVRRHLSDMRKGLGLCPQHEVLYDLLTIREHFVFYCQIKEMEDDETDEEVDDLLDGLDLRDKMDIQIKYLSRSCKRRVAVGISLIGYPRTVIMDEPTLGLDPDSRRLVWDYIRERCLSRTIIVTSQLAEEAESLAKRVAVINRGQVLCCGTPDFLAEKYGVGYRLTIEKNQDKPFEAIKNFFEIYIPELTCVEDSGSHVTLLFQIHESHKIEAMLSDLEQQKLDLSVTNFDIEAVTLEDVLINLATCSPEATSETSNGVSSEHETENEENNAALTTQISLGETETEYQWTFIEQLKGQLVKRSLVSARCVWLTLVQAVLPILIITTACFLVRYVILPPEQPPMMLTLSDVHLPQAAIMADIANVRNIFGIERIPWVLTKLLKQAQGVYIKHIEAVGPGSITMSEYLVFEGGRDQKEFSNNLMLAIDFHSPRLPNETGSLVIDGYFNDQAYHAPGILLNVISNTILGIFGYPDITIRTLNEPLPLPRSAIAKVHVEQLAHGGHDLVMYFLVALAVVLGTFSAVVVRERATRAKQFQRSSGMNMAVFWLSTFLWDFFTMFLIFCAISIIFLWFGVKPFIGINFFMVLLVFTVTACTLAPSTYVMARLYATPLAAFNWLALLNIVTGQISLLLFFHMGALLRWILYTFFPNVCFLVGLHNIIHNYYYTQACERSDVDFSDICIYIQYTNLSHPCCPRACGVTCGGYTKNYLSWEDPGIGKPLLFLICHGLAALWFLYFSECPRWRNLHQIKAHQHTQAIMTSDPSASESVAMDSLGYSHVHEDADIIDERARVWSCPVEQLKEQEAILILGVRKSYGRCLALNDINIGIHHGEALGLLGPAGSGKSALLQIVSGTHHLNAGQVYVNSYSVLTNLFEVTQGLGYCPQHDNLIDELTVRETLFLIGRIRGILKSQINDVVDNMMDCLLLSHLQHTAVAQLKSGERRAVQVSAALLAEPEVLLLDDPLTKLDSVRQKRLVALLQQMKSRGRTIMITVNSLQEAEMLCSRVAVMVNGQLQCLGTPQHLKKRYDGGWDLVARVEPSPVERVESKAQALVSYISQHLQGAALCHTYEGTVYYRIAPNAIPLPLIFGIMERGKADYDIECYSVTRSTFDHVLLRLFGSQRPARRKRTARSDGWNFRRFVHNVKRMIGL